MCTRVQTDVLRVLRVPVLQFCKCLWRHVFGVLGVLCVLLGLCALCALYASSKPYVQHRWPQKRTSGQKRIDGRQRNICPSLRNSTGHLILRKREQLVQLFGPQVGTLLGSNPRYRILPAYDDVLLDLSALASRLCNTTVPIFYEADGAFTNAREAGVLTHELLLVLWEEVCAKERGCPWLSSEVVQSAEDVLFTYPLRGGAWDKALFRLSGFCMSLFVTDSSCGDGLTPRRWPGPWS